MSGRSSFCTNSVVVSTCFHQSREERTPHHAHESRDMEVKFLDADGNVIGTEPLSPPPSKAEQNRQRARLRLYRNTIQVLDADGSTRTYRLKADQRFHRIPPPSKAEMPIAAKDGRQVSPVTFQRPRERRARRTASPSRGSPDDPSDPPDLSAVPFEGAA